MGMPNNIAEQQAACRSAARHAKAWARTATPPPPHRVGARGVGVEGCEGGCAVAVAQVQQVQALRDVADLRVRRSRAGTLGSCPALQFTPPAERQACTFRRPYAAGKLRWGAWQHAHQRNQLVAWTPTRPPAPCPPPPIRRTSCWCTPPTNTPPSFSRICRFSDSGRSRSCKERITAQVYTAQVNHSSSAQCNVSLQTPGMWRGLHLTHRHGPPLAKPRLAQPRPAPPESAPCIAGRSSCTRCTRAPCPAGINQDGRRQAVRAETIGRRRALRCERD